MLRTLAGMLAFIWTLLLQNWAFADEQPYTLCFEEEHSHPRRFTGEVTLDKLGVLQGAGTLISEAAEKVGMNLKFVRYPWRRCNELLKANRVDGIFAMSYTDSRNGWAAFPKKGGVTDDRHLFFAVYKFFVPIDGRLQWDGESLKPNDALVQSVPGYTASLMLLDMGFRAVTNLPPTQGLQLVALGRLDGYVLESTVGHDILVNEGLHDKVTTLPLPFFSSRLYVVFSKARYREASTQIENFWSALKEVREQYVDF